MFERHFINQGRVHRFVVTNDRKGWEVREEEDEAVLRRARRQDWHRVERDIQLFEMRALALMGGEPDRTPGTGPALTGPRWPLANDPTEIAPHGDKVERRAGDGCVSMA